MIFRRWLKFIREELRWDSFISQVLDTEVAGNSSKSPDLLAPCTLAQKTGISSSTSRFKPRHMRVDVMSFGRHLQKVFWHCDKHSGFKKLLGTSRSSWLQTLQTTSGQRLLGSLLPILRFTRRLEIKHLPLESTICQVQKNKRSFVLMLDDSMTSESLKNISACKKPKRRSILFKKDTKCNAGAPAGMAAAKKRPHLCAGPQHGSDWPKSQVR